jgi:hypothetical protein
MFLNEPIYSVDQRGHATDGRVFVETFQVLAREGIKPSQFDIYAWEGNQAFAPLLDALAFNLTAKGRSGRIVESYCPELVHHEEGDVSFWIDLEPRTWQWASSVYTNEYTAAGGAGSQVKVSVPAIDFSAWVRGGYCTCVSLLVTARIRAFH